ERYGCQLSLGASEGGEHFVLGADDATSRRALDLGGMIDHLADKFAWVSALPDADHVSRFRIAGAAAHPDRVEEVVGGTVMGRSLLEGGARRSPATSSSSSRRCRARAPTSVRPPSSCASAPATCAAAGAIRRTPGVPARRVASRRRAASAAFAAS